jgi:hypothetical protein
MQTLSNVLASYLGIDITRSVKRASIVRFEAAARQRRHDTYKIEIFFHNSTPKTD